MAGYRSYAAIAEWIADVPAATALALDITPDRRPSEAMIRRWLQPLDLDLLTAAISSWLSITTVATAAQRRAIAVDGKTLRSSRTTKLCGPARPRPPATRPPEWSWPAPTCSIAWAAMRRLPDVAYCWLFTVEGVVAGWMVAGASVPV
ncbi:hypothetical protein [Micromonospora cremea]|uniref:hypothetical protein n=1 Tax=Micromonospora cremea TaxID=709881 RepID=UPI001FCA4F8E|nr:hypothetical protein [Micromonospora cremea]